MTKLERIMNLITEWVCGDKILGPNELRPRIAAILNELDTTEDLIAAQGIKPVADIDSLIPPELADADFPDHPEPN